MTQKRGWDESLVKRVEPPAPRGTIVVVEDDDDLRSVCSEALRRRGFHVTECATLVAGRAAVERVVPSVLLLDHDLPDGVGLDLARSVRCCPSYEDVRVLVFSGRCEARDVEEAFRAGCDAFVAKPCAPPALIAEIEALLRVS